MAASEISPELLEKKADLVRVLQSKEKYAPILGFELDHNHAKKLDLSVNNQSLSQVDLSNTEAFSKFIDKYRYPYKIGIGGYDEDRMVYQRSLVFGNPDQARSVHLGIDLWGDAYTEVFSPLSGKVHSFAFNEAFGDYGATLILQHELDDITFYTLYGHLTRESINNVKPEQALAEGAMLGCLGEPEENGHWPPHLHFQIITDMLGMSGDFPGVASKRDREFYLNICPDPNLILRSEVLRIS